MFRITNTQTRTQEKSSSRDELLALVNEMSVWAEDRKESLTLQLEQLSDEGTILDTTSVNLPLQGYVEEVLENFGRKKEKKNFSFIQRKSPKVEKPLKASVNQESLEESKQELRKPVSAPNSDSTNSISGEIQQNQTNLQQNKVQKGKSQVSFFHLLCFGLVGGIACFALVMSLHSNMVVQTQLKEANHRISFLENQNKADVVGRFFIANYFSGESSRLNAYLSKNLKAEGVDAKKGQVLQSTIFESAKSSSNAVKITYVVSTKTDNKIKTFRLILSLKKDHHSTFGYVLTQKPHYLAFIK